MKEVRLGVGAAVGLFLLGVVALAMLAALIGAGSQQACGAQAAPIAPSGRGVREVPGRLIPIYQAAAARYELGPQGWAYLAAINRIETTFGTNLSTSSAGAQGWMQFMPGTWATYGVDANGDGRRDPNNPMDAIFAAARYLHASGAPGDWRRAIFAYNHADWYVADIVSHARGYMAAAGGGGSGGGGALAFAAPIAAVFRGTNGGTVRTSSSLRLQGLATTYGNDPKIGWIDHQDKNNPALQGATNDVPGIAVYNNGTLGGWWLVVSPGGKRAILQQTDIGPAPGTGAVLDVNAVAARVVFGVPASRWPSKEGVWHLAYLGKTRPPGANTPAQGGTLVGDQTGAQCDVASDGEAGVGGLGIPGAIGQVRVAPQANRPGAPMSPTILAFLRRVAGITRRPIVVTTGTRHNKMTLSGNVSDHYAGNAADIGMGANGFTYGGPGGTRIAAAGLIAAGDSPAVAVRKAAAGGLHNRVWRGYRVQVIWRSFTGGNHYNHVHIGIRAANPGDASSDGP